MKLSKNGVYYPLQDQKHLKVSIDYELGGTNYFSGGYSERGLYMYCTIVELSDGFEKYAPFDNVNFKIMLLPLKKASSKKLVNAIALLHNNSQNIQELVQSKDIEGVKKLFSL